MDRSSLRLFTNPRVSSASTSRGPLVSGLLRWFSTISGTDPHFLNGSRDKLDGTQLVHSFYLPSEPVEMVSTSRHRNVRNHKAVVFYFEDRLRISSKNRHLHSVKVIRDEGQKMNVMRKL